MNPTLTFLSPVIVATVILATGVLFNSEQAVAQSPPPKATTTWTDLGFSQLPEGFSTDEIPLFEGLNEARGTWTFEGETVDGDAAIPVKGSLQVMGNPKSGMLPAWKMTWGWPVDAPTHAIHYSIMASPRPTGFDLMLFRAGPVKKPVAGTVQPKIQPSMFQGKWDLENRVINWTESDLPTQLRGQDAKEGSSDPKQSFEMAVDADGRISIRNGKQTSEGQMLAGKALVRTGDSPALPATLTGKHRFKTVAEISDQRIKSCLPPQATEITLLSERGGHFARYKITETDLIKFLDKLWEAKKDSSAHKRDMMAGEGEPARRESMVRNFKATGWEPLENAIAYYSPSKRNGAITTYYYDREAGIAYHNAGYW